MSYLTASQQSFVHYAAQYNKSYGSVEEYNFRFDQFMRTDLEIETFNAKPNQTSTVGHNKFSDWTAEEYDRVMGNNPSMLAHPWNARDFCDELCLLEDTIDWISAGDTTPVKDQGNSCGSPWAFAATALLESNWAIETLGKEHVSLSEQQLVDCSTDDKGCSDGFFGNALWYGYDHKFLLNSDYPYKGETNDCTIDETKGLFKVWEVQPVMRENVKQIKAALTWSGPLAVSIKGDSTVFKQYTGGIISSEDCGTDINFAVLAVGYSKEGDMSYLHVKNSFGTSWGEDGFAKIALTDGVGICGTNQWITSCNLAK